MKLRRILSAPVVLILCACVLAFVLVVAIVTRPAAPEISASHIASTGQIRLSWEPVSGAGSYKIYRAAQGEEDHQLIHTTKDPDFTDTTAEIGIRYRYYVRAVSSLLFSSNPGTEVFCTRILPQPVIRIAGVDATGHTKILWDTIEDADHYRLYRCEDGNSWELLESTRNTYHTDELAEAGTEYFYRVQAVAVDTSLNSAYSDVLSRTPTLSCPEVSLINDPDTGAPVLQWEPVKDASGYEILRAEDASGSYHTLAVTQESFHIDLEGKPKSRYRYQVKALSEKAGADSALSPEVQGTHMLARPQVVLGCDAPTGNVTLTWEPVPYAAGYEIYWSVKEDGDYALLKATDNSTYVDTAGMLGESYFYRVQAVAADPEANSALSSIHRGTFSLPCPVVTGSNDAATGKVQLRWDAVEGASRYEVYRKEENEEKPELLGSTKKTSFTDTTGVSQSRYHYSVVAQCQNPDAASAHSLALEQVVALPAPTITVSNHSTKGRVKISWKEIEGAVGYEVYRASSKDGEYSFLTDSDNEVCLDNTGKADRTYYYKALALAEEEAANSALSDSQSGTYHYPDKLTLTAETNNSGNPHLEWNEVKNGVKYRLFRSMLPTGGFSRVSNSNGVAFTDSGVLKGVSYYYKVKALDKEGEVINTSNTVCIQLPLSGEETFKTRYINLPKAWVYTAPTIEADSTPVRYMDKIKLGNDVMSTSAATWYRVLYKDTLCYMRVEKDSKVLASQKKTFQYKGETKRQQQVIDLALEISEEWKTTYAHGQSDGVPDSKGVYGFNCTGLVRYILGTVMQKTVPSYRLLAPLETLYETTSIYNQGYPGEFFATDVKRKNIQPGDVLFFTSQADGSDSDEIGHCGIYLGNNEFVHATSAWEDAVCIVPLTDSFEENLVAIRRYLPTKVTPANTKETLTDSGTHNLYKERSRKSTVVTSVAPGGTVTVLFTDNADWAWVRTEDGKEGFIRVENFK